MERKEIAEKMAQMLDGLPYTEAIPIVDALKFALIKKVIDEEIGKNERRKAKAICPPSLWKALQEKFPDQEFYKDDR